MTPAQLAAIGRGLYGSEWQTPLGAALGVSDRTVRRWVAGEYEIPAGVDADLATLAKASDAASSAANAILGRLAPLSARLYPVVRAAE